jgi:putative polyketide hydroxylase
MNTAIRDGYDLGWKLAWVMRGWGGERLLDSYEEERRPIAEHTTARSARANGSEGDVVRELHADLGGRIAHLWVDGEARRTSTLDLLGDGLTLFTGPGGDMWRRAARPPAARLPLTAHTLDALTVRALGVVGRGALLVRPDGQPVSLWTGDVDAARELSGAVAALAAGTRNDPVQAGERAA